MNAIELIAKHLDRRNLKLPVVACNTVCSFTAEPITEGVRNSDLIKDTFTDHAFLRHPSAFSSVAAALCIEAVIPAEKGLNALRNYSYIATADRLQILRREEIMQHFTNPPTPPFVFCVTYSNKKHTAYKAALNLNQSEFTVTTDRGNLPIISEKLRKILPILEAWYRILPGKKGSAQEPTYFTKADILTGCDNQKKINEYGLERYFKESAVLDEYRQTALLELVVHALNKSSDEC